MKSICGADCAKCNQNMICKGCANTNGCPFSYPCFIAKMINEKGMEYFEEFKVQSINEINSLNIPHIKLNQLYPLNGSFVNLEYTLPNGNSIKLLNNNAIYLGNQVTCQDICFGIVCNEQFILISQYEQQGINPKVILYKER